MPRPRVLPENRRRAYEACVACRITKKRCSGTFPCTKCIHMGRADSCVPTTRSNIAQRPSNPDRVMNPPPSGATPRDTSRSSISNHSTHDHASNHASVESGSRSPEALHRTRPRMLRNLQGERVYVGRAASLSFLQLLRDMVTQHIGPSQFSHNLKLEDMLETETPHDISPVVESEIDPYEILDFVRQYRIALSGFVHIPSDSEIDQTIYEPTQGETDSQRTKSALRDIKIAIGAQSSKSDPASLRIERFFFARGQRRAFAGMVENPSLELVKLFLLMSYYMLGACRRNAAFMYLGIAARAAVALGLHLRDTSGVLPTEQERERTYVWMSLRTSDLLTSSILGRPPATSNLRSEFGGTLIDLEQSGSKEERLNASYRMSQILEEIIDRLYGEKTASTETAEALLEKLSAWSNSLPELLLASPSTDMERLAAQEHIIGSLHIACTYHFAVIIVTRPFLISVLGVRLARLCQTPAADEGLVPEDAAHSKLATACIDSALYMVQTCMEVYHSRLMLGNMCILKAFIFAAALVLGFSMFSHKEADSAVEEAFNGALQILQTLAQQSAQASHYYEILTLLKSAIDEQRQRLMQYSNQHKNRYVSKLFSLSSPNTNAGTQDNIAMSVESNESLLTAPLNPLDSWSFMDPPENNSDFPGWDGMELPLWDSFPFMPGSLQMSNRTSESN
ncbi:hypothetical protein FE257_012249 [Aspergillus nanangensis]|uniref:Zn(2)-C6 fungal-type domain-containing protein n=1 Tax=Aspergillus nanangensis TaxID=2582783 RepID=A0AAD4CG39_ASPNN|nr:hypothetical protein FE257_012249 [Aspergillus nanangensis]